MKKLRIPKPEEQFDYFTNVPNMFIDELMRYLPPQSFVLLMIFSRKLYGYHKDRDYISSTQLIEISGMSNKTVSKHLQILLDNNIIIKTRKEEPQKRTCAQYKLNTDIYLDV